MKNIFSSLFTNFRNQSRRGKKKDKRERGQVLIIVALAVIGLTAAVGLTVDVGLLYLNHGKLRRAVDAAALSATSQFREGYSTAKLSKAAEEFLVLNGINDPTATVETCDSNPGDPELCTEPRRKLVRVRATSVMKLAFLPVIGIHTVTISASAISEAASMDVVFVIDASDSMTYDAPPDDPMRDPSQCNPAHECHPFEEVKAAAKAFVDQLYIPYDRVAVVTFDDSAHVAFSFEDYDKQPTPAAKKAAVMGAITNLNVVQPDICDTSYGPCRQYERDALGNIIDVNHDGIGDTYLGFDCPIYHDTGNPETCGTTATGKGLLFAANQFSNKATFRQEALWVVILLTDGATNAPSIVCPNSTWTNPFCRDANALSRHCDVGDTACVAKGGFVDPDNIDTDDYARSYVDFLADKQGALIFTIGLGSLVRTSVPRVEYDLSVTPSKPKVDGSGHQINCDTLAEDCWGAGEQLLNYAADTGRGKYYFAPSGNQLREIFLDIAQNLATRLTK